VLCGASWCDEASAATVNPPEVSIILPTQGVRASLPAALRSALAQDFASFEVVVVDDSIDAAGWTSREEFAYLLADPRVRVVPFHQGCGCAAAKNAGLREARGQWACYLDDDNEYYLDKVSAQHALARETGSPVVLCGLEIRVKSRRRLRQVDARAFSGDALLLEVVADTNVLFHRCAAGPFWDEALGAVDDACFFQALIEFHALQRVPNVPRPLAVYYAHGGARANRALQRVYRGNRRLLVRWSRRYDKPARRILLVRMLVAFCKFRSGGWLRLLSLGAELVRSGGWREWRVVANAVVAKLPFIRRWMVT
jgi:glycosyltransferase involved in cell wall biosynthesis